MQSMTGFAATAVDLAGGPAAMRWRWEAKSVNGRGLDLRFRLGQGFETLEPDLRALTAKRFSRGVVTIGLRADGGGEAGPRLNERALAGAIESAKAAERAAADAGLYLAPSSVSQLLAIRGVMDGGEEGAPSEEAVNDARASFSALLDDLAASRAAEGARTAEIIAGLVDRISALTAEADAAFDEQRDGAAARLTEKLAALKSALKGTETEVSPERLTQELAVIAVRGDIREELDRLTAHVAAARELISADEPVGRKLDFLTQEFNREANTLCSKSGSVGLTAVGLELKAVVDQLREQAQNIE